MSDIRIAPIDGYDGYFVTSDGKVIGRQCKRPLRPSLNRGYERVSLVKDGEIKNYFVHRLVATAFIPNPHGYPIINHKDENPRNNNVDNLEWVTYAYNNSYGTKGYRGGMSQRNRVDCSKSVIMMNSVGEHLTRFPSSREAERQTGISGSHIRECCNGIPKHNTAGGYKWKWGEMVCQ